MTARESQVGISGTTVMCSPPLMPGQLVGVHRVDDELGADEGEDHREAVGQVDQPVEQAVDEEEQLPQAEQREGVGGEDQVGVLGQTEDRRDRVDAKMMSALPMAMSAMASGVMYRLPCSVTVIRSPW